MSAAPHGRAPQLTTESVRELARAMVGEDLVVVPVRHHSPACSYHLTQLLTQTQPSRILVEGPADFDDLIEKVTDPRAVMPLALYSYSVLPPGRASQAGPDPAPSRQASYYPLCDYSPELVALRWAREHGVPAQFIDLSFAQQHVSDVKVSPTVSLMSEAPYTHSRTLNLLAAQVHARDTEDLWEYLVEADAHSVDTTEHVARIVAYCLSARSDCTDEDLAADGTADRESEMAWHVAQALDSRGPSDGPVLVVQGGFHAVALLQALGQVTRPNIKVPAKATGGQALIRYSFERLEHLNGYSAGMTSPAWHQLMWDTLQRKNPSSRNDNVLTCLLRASAHLRSRHQMPVSTPAVIAAYEQAQRLADLRGHVGVLRSDLVDSVRSCFVKGDIDEHGAVVHAALQHVLTGSTIGTLPPGTGTPPLVRDTFRCLEQAKLVLDDPQPHLSNLDIYRNPAHRATSAILHGLVLMDVPFATQVAGPDFVAGVGLERLQERWEYQWTPGTEGALVELSHHGSTLSEAVDSVFTAQLSAFRQSTAVKDSVQAVAALAAACVLALHHHLETAMSVVRDGVAADTDFVNVATAVHQLSGLLAGREALQTHTITQLPQLIRATYERAIYLARQLPDQPENPTEVVKALMQLRELIVSTTGEHLDEQPLWDVVDYLATHHESAMIRGGSHGLLYSARKRTDTELARAVAGQLGGTIPSDHAVAFTQGLLTSARDIAWQSTPFLEALDSRVSTWDHEAFMDYLPDLRLAFASMTPRETERIATHVARLLGVDDIGPLYTRDVDESSFAYHHQINSVTARLLRDDGLGGWVNESAEQPAQSASAEHPANGSGQAGRQ